jgi:hypothetical protein
MIHSNKLSIAYRNERCCDGYTSGRSSMSERLPLSTFRVFGLRPQLVKLWSHTDLSRHASPLGRCAVLTDFA